MTEATTSSPVGSVPSGATHTLGASSIAYNTTVPLIDDLTSPLGFIDRELHTQAMKTNEVELVTYKRLHINEDTDFSFMCVDGTYANLDLSQFYINIRRLAELYPKVFSLQGKMQASSESLEPQDVAEALLARSAIIKG